MAVGQWLGRGDSTKERANQISHAQCNQFCVGIMSGLRHTIRNYSREQRFNGAQYGDRDCGGKQGTDDIQRESERLPLRTGQIPGECEQRRCLRNSMTGGGADGIGKTAADGGNVPLG